MQTITTSWVDADGVTHSVTTERLDGESVADWLARHQAAVDAAKKQFPPV